MSHCRLLLDDYIGQATLTAPNTAAGMGADRLKTDPKGEACRILSGTGQIVATWPTSVTVGVVVIPACNLGPSSVVRVRAYSDTAGTVLLEDTGFKPAAPGAILENWTFTQPLNVNAFSEYSTCVAAYLTQHQAIRCLIVELVDASLPFLDVSKLVVGAYLELEFGANYGAAVGVTDMSTNARAASGDLRTDWAPRTRNLTFDLGWVTEQARSRVFNLLKSGVGKWLFADLLYGNDDPVLRQDYMLYGKCNQAGTMGYHFYRMHEAKFNIEGY